MFNSIANLKENLSKIALDVHDDEDDDGELEIYASPDRNADVSSPLDLRRSRGFASPVINGFDSLHNAEIEQYKAEIKKLKESEAEIKALSVNYAALLKDKEDWILRLNEENGLLKKNLNSTRNLSRNESLKTSTISLNGSKGTVDQSPNRQHKGIMKNRLSFSNQTSNGFKHDRLSNGSAQPDVVETMVGSEMDLADLLEEKEKTLAAFQSTCESEIKKVMLELEGERSKLANVQLQLQEEQKLNGSFLEELKLLKVERDKTNMEVNRICDDMNQKVSEVSHLQMKLNRLQNTKSDDSTEGLKSVMAALEKENSKLKVENAELQASLQTATNSSTVKFPHFAQQNSNNPTNVLNEDPQSSGSFPGKQEMELSLQKLEKELKEERRLKDKTLQELNRLKKHLLDKENEESEKMDEDSKIIEELQEKNEYQRIKIQQLEKALNQAMASQEDAKMANHNELQRSGEIIDDLNGKLTNYMSMIDAKNVELLNLQTALGQYYAEIEAKEYLEAILTHAREESSKLAEQLKDAHQREEVSQQEKEAILEKLSQAERIQAEGRGRVNKLEEDNAKLRRALEQSMSRINRMSVDSDYFVDRRIVIKLLVTYFQRNHSREVLDLMVRMLGFSDEDKQRIGVAQQGAGKGVVRGVLGLPGRLVGGIIGGSPAGASANMASDNQSFADLWVDFLLKETEERERRESEEANKPSNVDQSKRIPNGKEATSPFPDHRTNNDAFSRSSPSPFLNNPISLRVDIPPAEHLDSEFSTVPLTLSDHSSQASRLLTRY